MRTKRNFISAGLFGGTLFLIFLGYYIVCYYQMRLGDDILFPYYMGFQHYLDGSKWFPEEKVRTVGMAVQQFVEYYTSFSGRITSLFQGLLYNWMGERLVSVVSACVYTGIVCMICHIGFGSWRKVKESPLFLLLVSIYMYWLTPTGTYISMWTFVCQYAIPVLVYLLYYYIVIGLFSSSKKISLYKKIGIFVLGFFCGWCHECLSFFLIILVSVKALKKEKRRFVIDKEKIKLNIGLYLGYFVIVIAPGNFKRMFLEHDVARTSAGLIEKLEVSAYEHLVAAGVLTRYEVWMPLLFILFFVYCFIKTKRSVLDYVQENIEFVIVGILSIFVWAVFAPPVPQYGLQMWKACIIILLLKGINPDLLSQKLKNIFVLLGMAFLIFTNTKWMGDLIGTTREIRMQVLEAKAGGETEIHVKGYPESTYNYLTMYNIANNTGVLKGDCAFFYYGVEITVEEY